MLQQPEPDDFVLATGETHPVREFVEKAFAELDMDIKSVSHSFLLSPWNIFAERFVGGKVPAWMK